MEKDDATWLNVAYLGFLGTACYVAYKAMETVGIQTGWMERYEWYGVAATALCFVIGGLLTWYLRADKDRHDYFLSSISELRKVTWPTWSDTKRMTLVVCVVVGIFAVIVSAFDILWAKVLGVLIA